MSEDIRVALAKIRELAPHLNASIDQLAVVVKEVESFLNDECGLTMPVTVSLAADSTEPDVSRSIEYRKVGQRFRVSLVLQAQDHSEPKLVKPWAECSRDEKLLLFRVLPSLLRNIAARVESESLELREASEAAVDVVNSLRELDRAGGNRETKEGKR